MRAIACLMLLMGWAGSAWGQSTFSLDPAQADAGVVVNLRIDNVDGCFQSNNPTVERNAGVVVFRAYIEDARPPGPCPPQWVTPRLVSLGSFAPGSYQVQVFICTNSPAPDPCVLTQSMPLVITGSREPLTVPTLSGALAMALAALVAIVGLLGRPQSM